MKQPNKQIGTTLAYVNGSTCPLNVRNTTFGGDGLIVMGKNKQTEQKKKLKQKLKTKQNDQKN
jgi:hypothetical protein